jgi:hypothetical protein
MNVLFIEISIDDILDSAGDDKICMKRLDNIDNLHRHRSTEHNASVGV